MRDMLWPMTQPARMVAVGKCGLCGYAVEMSLDQPHNYKAVAQCRGCGSMPSDAPVFDMHVRENKPAPKEALLPDAAVIRLLALWDALGQPDLDDTQGTGVFDSTGSHEEQMPGDITESVFYARDEAAKAPEWANVTADVKRSMRTRRGEP